MTVSINISALYVLLFASPAWGSALLRKDGARRQAPKNYKVTVLRTLPHNDKPFTQGLEFDKENNFLVETSGSFPPGTHSYVRAVNLEDGGTLWKSTDALEGSFIEGITRLGGGGADGRWFASTYQEPRKVLEYDSKYNFVQYHSYDSGFDGWGLTHNVEGTHFLATNGSSTIMTLEPGDFKLKESKAATCMGKTVSALNELEMVSDFLGSGRPALLGNVYTSRVVLVLDPVSFECTGAFHLEDLSEPMQSDESLGYHVANGIAYDPNTHQIYLTGKNWEKMFAVKLEEEDPNPDGESAFQKLTSWMEMKHGAPGILSLLGTDSVRS